MTGTATERYVFHTLDVFTDHVHGGNPLAVVPDARGLTAGQMQSIAREFNISETVFVLPPADARHTRRLRIFTPRTELPFAGHPTIGAAHLLASLGEVSSAAGESHITFEEGVGPVPVVVRSRGDAPAFAELRAAQLPEPGPEPPPSAVIAAALSLTQGDVGTGEWEPAGVSCGVGYLFVPLRDVGAVSRARLDRGHWQEGIAGWWASSICVFARDPDAQTPTLRARVFGPAVGIEEDPATGSAAVALAGYLAARDTTPTGRLRWVVRQGVEMGRPSTLFIEADKRDGSVTATRVGGAAVRVSDGTMTVPPSPDA